MGWLSGTEPRYAQSAFSLKKSMVFISLPQVEVTRAEGLPSGASLAVESGWEYPLGALVVQNGQA